MLNRNALTNLADTKSYLNIEGNAQDILLRLLINSASEFVEKQCRRSFTVQGEEEDPYTEIYDGSGGRDLLLNQYPIVEVESVTYGEATLTEDEDFRVLAERGVLRHLKSTWGTKEESITVEYTAGYSDIPSDLQYLCLELVKRSYEAKKTGNLKSESTGAYSVSYGTILEGDEMLQSIINSYKKTVI